MTFILRALGLEALAWLSRRLPDPWPRRVSLGLTVFANLLPIFAVWRGWIGIADVLALFWIENLIVWLTSIVRIATAGGPGTNRLAAARLAAFFTVHYGGFTYGHGLVTRDLVDRVGGLTGGYAALILPVAFLVISHFARLGFFWFGREERLLANPGGAMLAPYPRMVAMHLSVIAVGLLGLDSIGAATIEANAVKAAAAVCLLKLAVDLLMTKVGDRILRANGGIK